MSFQIPGYRIAYTFTQPTYPPSEAIHRSQLNYVPPADNEISIEIAAAGLNPVDVQVANTRFWWMDKKKEKGLGQDYSGTIIQAGRQALLNHPHLTPGTAVFGLHLSAGSGSPASTLSTHINLDPSIPSSSCILPLPPTLSPIDAASIPLVWLTSYTALVQYGGFDKSSTPSNAGRSVVILGASGGTGSYAVQIAKKLLGIGKVVGVCSGKNEKFVLGLGADEVIDYATEEGGVVGGLRRLKPEGGWDFIYDCVGGKEVVNVMGELVNWGGGGFCTIVGDKHERSEMGGAYTNRFYPSQLFRTFLGWLGLSPQYHCINLTPSLAYFAPILSLLEKKTLDIPIEGVFPFTPRGVEDAFKTLDGGRARGKVVVGVKGFKERVE